MNTITQIPGLLTNPSTRQAFRAEFKALAHRRELNACHMALFALALGKPLGRTFSPITNATKLANGQRAWDGALRAIHGLPRHPWAKELFAKIGAPEVVEQMAREAGAIRAQDLAAQYASRA